MPEDFFVKEWHNHTTLNPNGTIAMLMVGVAMLLLPRRYAMLPIILMACFIPPAQRVVVFSLDFHFLRIMVLFGWMRLLLRSEFRSLSWMPMDTIILLWASSGVIIHTILYGTVSSFVNRLGWAFDGVGMYLLFRCIVHDVRDIEFGIKCFALVSLPVAIAFWVEWSTGRNVFGVLGGVPEITVVRDERMRCQGAFAHPILAGCFWASLMPVMASLWWVGTAKATRLVVVVGLASCTFIVFACASSTPLLAFFGVLTCGLFYFIRAYMKPIRWSIFVLLVILHFIMAQPVWHLIARVGVVSGSTSWYRFVLIDEFIRNIDEWFLIGTRSTAHWRAEAWDITNQFVLEGVNGGILQLSFFVALLTVAFRNIGVILKENASNRQHTVLAWAMGSCLFVHCLNFIGASYFGQIIMVWFWLLAMIASFHQLLNDDKRRLSRG